MLVEGKWLDNVTCKRCRMRHPAELTCTRAQMIAQAARIEPPLEPDDFEVAMDCIDMAMAWDEAKPAILSALRALRTIQGK